MVSLTAAGPAVVAASPPLAGGKKKTRRRSAERPSQQHPVAGGGGVRWGSVYVRELLRLVGGSGAVPDETSPDYALGLSDVIVARDALSGELRPLPPDLQSGVEPPADSDSEDDDGAGGSGGACKKKSVSFAPAAATAAGGSSAGGSPKMAPMHHSSPRSSHGHGRAGGGRHARSSGGGARGPSGTPLLGSLSPSPLLATPGGSSAGGGSSIDDMPELSLGGSAEGPAAAKPPSRRRRRATPAAGVVCAGTVDAVEVAREAWLVARLAALPRKERAFATGETRQFSHRSGPGGHVNPLFKPLSAAEVRGRLLCPVPIAHPGCPFPPWCSARSASRATCPTTSQVTPSSVTTCGWGGRWGRSSRAARRRPAATATR